MAIRKTGSRQIMVDGVEYRWRVRQKPTYLQGAFACSFAVSIQRTAGGCALLATAGARPDNWIHVAGAAVTPARIAATIRAALAAGWNPEERGSAFTLALADAEQ